MAKKRPDKVKPNEHLKEYLKTTPLQRLEWLEQANKFVYENHLAKIGTKPAPLKVSERTKQK